MNDARFIVCNKNGQALGYFYFEDDRVDGQPNACYCSVRSTGQCNTACSLSAGVWKPKVFRGR
jgi:hypothetical protein